MAISKALIASILISLLVLQLAEADQLIVEEHVLLDAVYRLGRTSARGHAGVAAPAAAASSRHFRNLEVCPCYANITTRWQQTQVPLNKSRERTVLVSSKTEKIRIRDVGNEIVHINFVIGI
ncbi:hypothetical protein CJ030_MR8G002776 [Morella rubra]|uniref:Uncharacterized protein n=1 Tax=Morella rubra TaxID=262757 RepID=A0A6A1UUZ8_9ROSI|nr:hypothetical protein CJ030_MR8G002776 [Morella rubra]